MAKETVLDHPRPQAFQAEGIELTMEDFERIASDYQIGKLLAFPKKEKGGSINYNFEMRTDRGIFMVKVNTNEYCEKLIERKNLEYVVTDHLNSCDFEYDVPLFLQNSQGERLTLEEGRTFEIYERVDGRCGGSLEEVDPNEAVKALALMHRALSTFPIDYSSIGPREAYDSGRGLKRQLDQVRENAERDPSAFGALIRENFEVIGNAYDLLVNTQTPSPKSIITHGDFHNGNVLFSDSRLTGIIDFGCVKWDSPDNDISKLVPFDPEVIDQKVSLYREFHELSDTDAASILSKKVFNTLISIKGSYLGSHTDIAEKIRRNQKKIDDLKLAIPHLEAIIS